MKEIIEDFEKMPVVMLNQLAGNEIIAYRCQNSDNYAILAKLTVQEEYKDGITRRHNYGFVPLGQSNTDARYIGYTWQSTVRQCAKNRKLFVFKDTKELLHAIINNKF